jgi:hypothetical protein
VYRQVIVSTAVSAKTTHCSEFRRPFYVRDATGNMLIDPGPSRWPFRNSPDQSKTRPATFVVQTKNLLVRPNENDPALRDRLEKFLYGGPLTYKTSNGKWYTINIQEYSLPVGTTAYILGNAKQCHFIGEGPLYICGDDVQKYFLISDKPESSTRKRLRALISLGLIGGSACAVVSAAMLLYLFM